MLNKLVIIVISLACVKTFAGEGLTTITCNGQGVKITLQKADGGDAWLTVEQAGWRTQYSLDMQTNEKSQNLTAVINPKLGIVVAVGLKDFSQEIELVSIPQTAQTHKSKDTFSAYAEGHLPAGDYRKINLGCQSKHEI